VGRDQALKFFICHPEDFENAKLLVRGRRGKTKEGRFETAHSLNKRRLKIAVP
jgi:hypothetical protein